MAGDWIKMRLDLQSHPKIVRILSATKVDKFRVIGGLHAVWGVFDTHSIDGKLDGYTPDALDHIIGWPGFAAAVIAVGWLVFDGAETLILPEFDEHNGKSGKRRAEDQKRKRGERKSDKCPQNVRKMSDENADKNGSREEKSIHAVTNVTDADASPMPSVAELTKAELWNAGKSLLAASGMPAAQCGSFVGKLVKDYTDTVVIEAVRSAVVEQPADPASFLKACCQRLAGERKSTGVSDKFSVAGADFSASRAVADESRRRAGIAVTADEDTPL